MRGSLQTGVAVKSLPFVKLGLVSVFFVLIFAACDDPAESEKSCSGSAQCDPGFRCLEKVCTACVGSECDGTAPDAIGPSGGRICIEDDKICLDIPAGAVAVATVIQIERTDRLIGDEQLSAKTAVYLITPADLEMAVPATLEMALPSDEDLDAVKIWHRRSMSEAWLALESTVEQSLLKSTQVRRLGLVVAARPRAAVIDGGVLDTGVHLDADMIDTGLPMTDTGPPVIDSGVSAPDADPFDAGVDAGTQGDAGPADSGVLSTDAAAPDADPPGTEDSGPVDTGAAQDASPDTGANPDAAGADVGGAIIGLDASAGDGSASSATDATSPPVNNDDASAQMSTDALPGDATEDASLDASEDDGGSGPPQDPDSGGPPV